MSFDSRILIEISILAVAPDMMREFGCLSVRLSVCLTAADKTL